MQLTAGELPATSAQLAVRRGAKLPTDEEASYATNVWFIVNQSCEETLPNSPSDE